MGLEILTRIGENIASIFSSTRGVGEVFVITGIVILLIIGISMGIYYFIRLLKQLPNLTIRDFIKYTVIFATALIIVGIILP